MYKIESSVIPGPISFPEGVPFLIEILDGKLICNDLFKNVARGMLLSCMVVQNFATI